MKWILVIFMWSHGGAITTIPYSTQQACLQAGDAIHATHPMTLEAICIPHD